MFSNFSEIFPFVIKNISYKTPVHYYQAERFSDPVTKQRIINAQTARIANQIANNNKNLLLARADDNTLMFNALRAKFSQHPDLATTLVATSPKRLINHSLEDSYWADGGDGSGSNFLGKLLEQVRTELASGTLTSNPYYG